MSKSTELDTSAKLYLIEAMRDYLDGYDGGDTKPMTTAEVIEFCASRFLAEQGWLIARDGEMVALTEWLQGLALPIEYTYCDIIDLAKSWGSIPENATTKQEDKICDNYFSFMANKVRQLFDGYRIPLEVAL